MHSFPGPIQQTLLGLHFLIGRYCLYATNKQIEKSSGYKSRCEWSYYKTSVSSLQKEKKTKRKYQNSCHAGQALSLACDSEAFS